MGEEVQDLINKGVEKRMTSLETTSANLLVAVEKQSVVIGLMAKVMLGCGAVVGTALAGAMLKVILK